MPLTDQGVNRDRYMLIPRVLIFVRRGEKFLLIKGAPTKRLWANKYNGVGGHVEAGEDLLAAARRELLEEAGVRADLRFCGSVLVEAGGNPGVGIFLFTGPWLEGEPKPSAEGSVEWVAASAIPDLPAVEDLPVLLGRIEEMNETDPPFSAHSYYDEEQRLVVEFSN